MAVLVWIGVMPTVEARPWRPSQIPNGEVNNCANCHISPFGGGPRNAFGQAVELRVTPGSTMEFWDADLASEDSDEDGFTNGEELGDPDGDFADLGPASEVTLPGDPASHPEEPMVEPISGLQVTGDGGATAGPATLTWQGGRGPFLVEAKGSLADSLWRGELAREDRQAELSLAGPAGFWRVFDLAEAPPAILTAHVSAEMVVSEDPVDSSGSGTGHFLLSGSTLSIDLHYQDLTGPAVAAHIHGPAGPDGNATVMVSLEPVHVGAFGASGRFHGEVELSPTQKAAVLAGNTYVNIHTDLYPGGEIRGQIMPAHFGVSLNGASARPDPISTPGYGGGLVVLIGNTLSFQVQYRDLPGPAVAAHIHGPAGPNESATVLIDLQPYHQGDFGNSGVFSGSISLTGEQLAYVMGGKTYINIHTETHPGGEIRGQIIPQVTGIPFNLRLSGEAAQPDPVDTTGMGMGHALLVGDRLFLEIDYRDLSGPAVAAHIHGPATTLEGATVMVGLESVHAGPFAASGTFFGSVGLTMEQKEALLAGDTYVNIHTAANPGGEIRGQLAPALYRMELTGDAERPDPVETPATGSGVLALVGNHLDLSVLYRDLSEPASASHIHGRAGLDEPATVLIGLGDLAVDGFAARGRIAGSLPIDLEPYHAVIDGETYINIHTSANPGGEIRGQILTPPIP